MCLSRYVLPSGRGAKLAKDLAEQLYRHCELPLLALALRLAWVCGLSASSSRGVMSALAEGRRKTLNFKNQSLS